MGDVICPGLFLVRASPTITIPQVKQYIRRCIGLEDELYRNGVVEVKIFSTKGKQSKVLISGILLPHNQIRARFGKRQMEGVSVFVQTEDFGIPRLANGEFRFHDLQLHNHLKEGQGHLPPIDIFHPELIEDFGPLDDLSTTIYLGCPKDEIKNTFSLETTGHLILYGNTIARDKQKSLTPNKREPYSNTEIVYVYSIESFQTILKFNKNVTFSKNASPFITSCEGFRCNIDTNIGLGVNGKILPIKALVAKFGYVPFGMLFKPLVLQEKMDNLETKCIDCNQTYKLLGIGPNMAWLAATCGCTVEDSAYTWGNENFFRLFLPNYDRVLYSKYEHPLDLPKEKLIRLTRGLLPLYDNVRQFRKCAYAAYSLESKFNRQVIQSWQTKGTVEEVNFLEDRVVKGKLRKLYAMKIRVERSRFWCEDGISKMRGATLVGASNFHVRGTIYDISNATTTTTTSGECIVTVVAFLTSDDKLEEDIRSLVIIPKPPTRENKAIRKAMNTWEKFTLRRQCLFPQRQPLKGTIEFAQVLRDYTIHDSNVWCAHVQFGDSCWTTLNDKLIRECYIGLDVNLPVVDTMGLRQKEETARVIAINQMAKDDYSSGDKSIGTLIKFICILPKKSYIYRSGSPVCSVRLWIIARHKDLYSNNAIGGLPAGEEKSDVDAYDFGPLDQFDEEEEHQEERHFKPPPISISAHQLPHHHHHIDVYVDKKLAAEQSPLELKNWRKRPTQDLSILDFLLQPSPHVKHMRDVGPQTQVNRAVHKQIQNLRQGLNPSQEKAIDTMMSSRLSLTQGSPGTGKTLTCAVGIANLNLVEKGVIILCAYTNYAANAVCDTLRCFITKQKLNLKFVRMMSASKEFIHLKGTSSSSEHNGANLLHVQIRKHAKWNKNPEVNQILKKEEMQGTAMLTEAEKTLLQQHVTSIENLVLKDADVIVCTVGCASDGRLECFLKVCQRMNRPLSALVVDEASLLSIAPTIPVLCLSPKRVWLIGDHLQLRPTVRHPSAVNACLDVSWFQFLMLTPYVKDNDVFRFLEIQYRMADSIASLVSKFSYDNLVTSSPDVSARDYTTFANLYTKLPELAQSNMAFYTYYGNEETHDLESNSRYNRKEIEITKSLILKLCQCNVDPSTICIISMYESHNLLMKQALTSLGQQVKDVRVATVDSFQGKQSAIIILNFVRSNQTKNIGFLRDKRRLNVAISRAVNFLLFVGDFSTLKECQIPDMMTFLELLDELKVPFIHDTTTLSVEA